MIEFEIGTPDNSGTFSLDTVVETLGSEGVPIAGLSADGFTAFVQNPDGNLTPTPITQLLSNAGYNLMAAKPQGTNFERVDPELRFLVDRFSDDDKKQAFLQQHLASNGVPNAQVMGSGSDWHYFDPNSKSWFALTNKPGMDFSDFAEYGPQVAKGVLGTVGALGAGTLGLAGGPAGAGAAAVAGGGGAAAAGEGLLQALGAGMSQDFRNTQDVANVASKVGGEALLGGATSLLPGGAFAAQGLRTAGRTVPSVLRAAETANKVLGSGPISRTAAGTMRGVEAVSGAGADLAGYLAKPGMPRDIATSLIPGLGQMQMAGFLAQGPAALAAGIPKAAQWLGRQADDLGVSAQTRNAISRIESLGQKIPERGLFGAEEAIRKASDRLAGATPAEIAQKFGQTDVRDVLGNLGSRFSQNAKQRGERIGTTLRSLGRAGSSVQNLAEETTGLLARGAQGGLRSIEGASRLGANAATLARPFEGRVLAEETVREAGDETTRAIQSLMERYNQDKTNRNIGAGGGVLASRM
jgi:hypothetical protein